MIRSALRRHSQTSTPIRTETANGVSFSTQDSMFVAELADAAMVTTMAIVPGPAVVGIASGTNAMSFVARRLSSADFSPTSIVSSSGALGNSIENPMELDDQPAADAKAGNRDAEGVHYRLTAVVGDHEDDEYVNTGQHGLTLAMGPSHVAGEADEERDCG